MNDPCASTAAAVPCVTRIKGRTWRFMFTLRQVVVGTNPDGSPSYTSGPVLDLTGKTYQARISFPFSQPSITLSPDTDATDLLHGVVAFKVAPSMTAGVTVEDPGEMAQTRIELDEVGGSDIDAISIISIRVVDPANATSALSFSKVLQDGAQAP